MPSFTLKNIPEPIYEKVKGLAVLHHRSINNEMIAILEQATTAKHANPVPLLERARKVRGKISLYATQQDLQQAKSEGASDRS